MIDSKYFTNAFTSLALNLNFKPSKATDVQTIVKETKAWQKLFYDVLSTKFNWDNKIFAKAIENLMISGVKYKQFPDISDFLHAVGRSPEQIADRMFDAVRKASSRHGQYKSVSFGKEKRHTVTHAVIDSLGGWACICRRKPEDIEKSFKYKFVDFYANEGYDNKKHLLGAVKDKNIIDLSDSKVLAIGDGQSAQDSGGKSQIERIKEAQMKKIGWKE